MTRHVSYSTIIICSAVYLIVGDLSWPYFIYCLIVLFLGIGWMVMTLVRGAKTLTVDRKES